MGSGGIYKEDYRDHSFDGCVVQEDDTALVRTPELYFLPSQGSATACVQAEKTNGRTGIKKHAGRGQ